MEVPPLKLAWGAPSCLTSCTEFLVDPIEPLPESQTRGVKQKISNLLFAGIFHFKVKVVLVLADILSNSHFHQ